MSKYRNVTKILVAAVGAVVAFLSTPAGQALIRQYPHLDAIVWGLVTVAALLHIPVPSNLKS